jgi:hypothetical protein
MRLAGACAILPAALLAAGHVHADEPAPRTSSLGWVRLAGAETCAGPRAVAEAVEKRLGRQVFVAPTRADVAVEGRIERAGPSGGWHATITLTDDRGAVLGTRELTSDAAECRALDARIALALALMIDPDAVSAPPAPVPLPPAPEPPAPPPPPEPPLPVAVPVAPRCDPSPPEPAASPRRWRGGVQLGFAGSVGLLPHPAPGATLRLHAVPPRGPAFEIGASVWPQEPLNTSWPGTSVDLVYASLSVCPLAITVAGASFFACAGVQVGSLRAQGGAFDPRYQHGQVVFDLTAAEVHVRRALLGPLFVAAGLGFLVPIVRDTILDVDPLQNHHQWSLSPVAGTAELALGIAFP